MDSGLLDRELIASSRRNQRRVKAKKVLVLALVAFAAGGAVWYGHDWWSVNRFVESTDDAYVGGDVTVIATKIPGFVAEVSITDNQVVRTGDLLVKIDDRDYRAALAKAEAAVAAEQARLQNLAAIRRLQQAVIAGAEADIEAAEAEIVVTRFDQDRYRKLSVTAAASLQDFQRADADHKQAVAGRKRAGALLEAARQQIEVIDTQIRQAEAALAGAEADRETAQLNVGYTELRAPIDGVVGNRSARKGSYASVGTQLVSIVPARGLWVDANFKEDQLAHMRQGQEAIIEADILPGEVFHGRVASLAPATGAQFSVLPAENATGNFTKIVQRVPVRILLDGDVSDFGRLRPGLSVTVRIDARPKPGHQP
ncbi:HlyD family secretion protein [Dongia deserti]|uniref:HlyD family secretion protein n=1 Tax=Dongia deserti TaxID=2268030 RepID=UPI000E65CC71|nr:HlyD family secretion protein [Dongia deserti]